MSKTQNPDMAPQLKFPKIWHRGDRTISGTKFWFKPYHEWTTDGTPPKTWKNQKQTCMPSFFLLCISWFSVWKIQLSEQGRKLISLLWWMWRKLWKFSILENPCSQQNARVFRHSAQILRWLQRQSLKETRPYHSKTDIATSFLPRI